MTNARQGAQKAGGSDPITNADLNLLALAVSGMRTMAAADGVSDELLLVIAERAVAQEKLQDPAWVDQQLRDAAAGTPPSTGKQAAGKPDPKQVFQEFLSRITPSQAAQPTNLVELQPILDAHKQWAANTVDPSQPLSGGRANLNGFDLSGFDLQGVDLRGASCQGTKFVGAQLDKACFISADLSQAEFTNAILTGAQFRRAKLHHTKFGGADLSGADFKLADSKYVQWPEPKVDVAVVAAVVGVDVANDGDSVEASPAVTPEAFSAVTPEAFSAVTPEAVSAVTPKTVS